MFDFSGQRMLFVGGTSGIGLATARIAGELGAEVTVASRSADKVESAVRAVGGRATGRQIDVTSDESVQQFFADSASWDHVVVTGSYVQMDAVRQLPMEKAAAAFDSKFWGFYRVARAAPIRAGGSLGVVAGYLASRPAAGWALMGAINGALECLVQGLALELKPVRVNAVSPSIVVSEMWAEMTPEAREAMYAGVAASNPVGRPGQPEDVARQLLLLAGTDYATGTVVTLDGGASIA